MLVRAGCADVSWSLLSFCKSAEAGTEPSELAEVDERGVIEPGPVDS